MNIYLLDLSQLLIIKCHINTIYYTGLEPKCFWNKCKLH